MEKISYKEFCQKRIIAEISKKCQNLNISKNLENNIINLTLFVYNYRILRGQMKTNVFAACMLYECEKNGENNMFDNILNIYQIKRSDIIIGINYLKKNNDIFKLFS